MFGFNSLEKSCIGPDCSSGRGSTSSRFPVGITSLGDENQQIRIQLAVHKYNSSASSSLNSRCSVASPFRHCFLNNPVKGKNYEGVVEGTSKNERRNGNQYEGVGTFPTIHLKKKAVRYRPIRRLNDVKVSHPELPVNRFLSNLPEARLDLKSSTRSVLDVLEDLSGKKINSKDDNGSISKTKSKGLGGDYILNTTALYKPLFVQKPKINSVITRDSTTQTFPVVSNDTPSPQNSSTLNNASDARAELRRKLAKQNNEIFASLSSSISLTPVNLKRKIGKITQSEDDNSTEGSASKNPKIDHQPINSNSNSISKSSRKSKTNSDDSTKINRTIKLHEPNSPTSPNKDRLTTIFLDMQNTSPKVQMFQNNIKTSDDDSQASSNGCFTRTTNGFCSKSSFPNGTEKSVLTENGRNDTNNENSENIDSTLKSGSTELKKPETGKPEVKFSAGQVSTTPSEATKTLLTAFQFGTNKITSDFNSSTTAQSDSKSNEILVKKLGNEGNTEKKKDENQFASKPFVFGNSSSKPHFSSFPFGANGSSSQSFNTASKDPPKALTSEAVTVNSTTTAASVTQFSFGTTMKATISPTQSFGSHFDVQSGQNTSTSPSKLLFAFGQSNSFVQQSSEIAKTTTTVTTNSLPTSAAVVASAPSVQSSAFSFGQETAVTSPVKTTAVGSEVNTSRSTDSVFSSGPITNSMVSMQAGKALQTFGDQQATSIPAVQQPYSLSQKAASDQNKVEEESGLKSKNLFSFGGKSTTQESQNAGVFTIVNSTSPSLTTNTSSIFGQNVPPMTSAAQIKFGHTSAPHISSSSGNKTETNSLVTTSAPTFNQSTSSFPIKTSLFGSSANGFTQHSTGLKPTPNCGSELAFVPSATAQVTSTFGAASVSQSLPVFGTSTTQSAPGFGVSPATQTSSAFPTSGPAPALGQLVTTQSTSTFPVSSIAQSGSSFGGTSTAQSASGFGTSLVTQSTPSFGISSSTPTSSTFGTSSSRQSTSGFSASANQPKSVFGASTSQPASAFGAPTTQSTSAFGVSTTQSSSAFGTPLGFGISTSRSNADFGTSTAEHSSVRFGTAVPQNNTTFGISTFNSTSTQQNTTFGNSALTTTSGFGASQSFSQPFENKTTSLGQSSGIFGQNQSSSFSSDTAFNSNQSSIFEQKPNAEEGGIFDQNKIKTPGFGTISQTFNSPNKYSFGMTTSSVTGFTASPPNTTSAPVFSFGSSTTSNTFTFGSGSSGSGNPQFAFKSSVNEPFKFGATTTTKEGTGFGGSTATFTFGGKMNNNALPDQKHSFSFGPPQPSTSTPFSFGTTPSASVFNFGGGSTPASSGSNFSFGTPTPGGPFGQPSTASPGAPFAFPGTFSIGSGSSQSRPRASSRPRRRP